VIADPASVGPAFDGTLAEGFVFDPISHWAKANPDKPAIVSRDLTFTYAELDAKTNQVARALAARGVRPGDRIGFVLPRGPQTVMLLIGILKAGAAYVPLDAESPVTRIKDCLEDAQPKLVVAEDGRVLATEEPAFTWIGFNELLDQATSLSGNPVSAELSSKDLAYIIFTSGTTGRPKGVPITHAALTNFAKGDQFACIRVEKEDNVFQGFSPASDGHHEEVWPTFMAGATLVVATSKEVYSGADLACFLEEHRVSIISCAPTLLSMVERDVPTLRRILFGAENLPLALVKRWAKPGREILNTYGPTEATVGATFSVCDPDKLITIGHPLPNYFCHIVDESLNLVPLETEGELCISGIGVSAGYLNRPAVKAGAFVPNPFGSPSLRNETLYRTGDRVRMDPAGNIVWLGRVDAQVKIRGHRIELSEIESHILSDPAIQSAVVHPRKNEDGDVQLVALLSLRQVEKFDVVALLNNLREVVPGYMIPQILEQVDQIPRLPSGKVDRRGCELLHGQAFRIEREIVPPRTEMERLVLDLWKDLFPQHEISSTDDFFRDLGGYSLLASKFVSLLRSEKGFLKVSVLDIYENPTVRSFASILEAQTEQVTYSPEFKPVPKRRYVLAKMWQALGLLFIFGLQGLFWLGPIIAAVDYSQEHSDFHGLLFGIALHAASVPVLVLIAIVFKWLIGGKFKEGSYPLWGTTYLRWWFVDRMLSISPVTFITGSPLAAVYLRMLGAKVGRNVFFESLEFDCADMIKVGNDCAFENGSWIHAAEVAHGELHIRPIRIGNGVSVGVRAGVTGGSAMEDGSALRDLSCISAGMTVPKGEEWMGSVARKSDKPIMPAYDPKKQPTTARLALFTCMQFVLVFALALLDSTPFVTVAFTMYSWVDGFFEYLKWEPLFAIVLVCFGAMQVLLVKWAVLGKLKPGTYDYPGWYWLRKWFSDKHLELSSGLIVPIYDSLFARPWCMSLGMKCGPRCEIALPRRMPYDLVSMGEESFLASEVSIGRPIRRNGKIMLEPTTIGKRSFLGNDSVVPQGTNVPEDFLLGVLSVCPRNEQIGQEREQAWLGSPPFQIPHRQVMDQFDPTRTYRPSPKLYAQRLAHEAVRIVLPSLCSLIVASILIEGFVKIWNTAEDWSDYPLGVALACIPIVYFVGVLVSIVICRLSKFILIGRYRPTIQPLWSQFVWRTETHSTVIHDFAAPLFISDLEGTSYMSAFMKFMGARIGRRAFINSTDWTETDLIHLGEDVAINSNAPLQAHLFEDRVMKVGPIKVGSRCSVGNYSVILCDSELKQDAHVGHLSLVMKGETIPSNTLWRGSPAQAVEDTRVLALES